MPSQKIMCLTVFMLILVGTTSKVKADDLTEAQKALQADIEHHLVAPCCWNMTVDQHESAASKKVRAEITVLIKEGKSKEEILGYFSSQPQYGERILATPSQDTLLGKSAYWLIPIMILFGACIVFVAIRRMTASDPAPEKKSDTQQPKAKSQFAEKVEDELKNLDS